MKKWWKDNVDYALWDRVSQDFLQNDVITADPSLEGQTVTDNKFVIGPRTGPVADITGLFHEMCHFAERPIEKLKMFPNDAWGFTFGKFYQIGTHWGYEPQSDQAVRCEQRVWAYQRSLQAHYGIEEDPYETVKSATYINAFTMYLCGQGKSDQQKLRILAAETEQMSRNEYNFERFQSEWKNRVELLANKSEE